MLSKITNCTNYLSIIFCAVIIINTACIYDVQRDNPNDVDNSIVLIDIPGGTFQRDATPANTSTVSAFQMSKREITRAQFIAVTGLSDPSNTSVSTGPNDPVQMTNWYHAIVFCNKLSIAEGFTPVYTVDGNTDPSSWGAIPTSSDATWDAATANWSANGYRLPTEMEWMWAAMGATSGYGYTSGTYTTGYSRAFAGSTGSNSIGDFAWTLENSSTTHVAGTRKANELGLYDMSGNVWEWCWDWDATYPSGASSDYRGAASGTNRIIRGGGWSSAASPYASVGNRYNNGPWWPINNLGFRVVRQ